MKYLECKPHPALADLVKCYWLLEKDYSLVRDSGETIWPDGCIDLIFHYGSPLHRLADGQILHQPPAFLIGQLKQPLTLVSTGNTTAVGIRFYAYGAYPFLRLPLKELADRTTDLELLFRGLTRDLAEQIADLVPAEAFQHLEAFLLRRLQRDRAEMQPIQAATRLLYQNPAEFDADRLSSYANLSRRSLERKFVEIVGYSPKTLARILRFNRLKDELMFAPSMNLTDLAYRYNYFDQAHFIHDFEQFTGQTPSSFAKKVINHQIYFYK